MTKFYAIFLSLAFLLPCLSNAQTTKRYYFEIGETTKNVAGKERKAIAINGSIPGPTLDLTEGDTAIITVSNLLQTTASIHWHGILIPNQYDGVPGLNDYPIQPGTKIEVKFPVKQRGTYWYHSHTSFQEQQGLYGPIVIHKRNEPKQKEQVLMFSDWTNIRPKEVMRLLRRGTDWFSIKKKSVQSYGTAITSKHLGDRIKFDWKRMPSADISDVYYNAFLTNGVQQFNPANLQGGDKIKLRLINGSSSSYFWVQFAGGSMQVIAADGQDIQPVTVDKLLISTAETYDVIVTLPTDGKYELRATSQDIVGYTSTWLGSGTEHTAATLPAVDYFTTMQQLNKMMYGSMKGMKMGYSKAETNIETDSYPMKNMVGMKNLPPDMEMQHNTMNMQHNMDAMDMTPADDDTDKKSNHGMSKMDMPADSTNGMDMENMDMSTGMKLYGFDYPPGTDTTHVLNYKMLHAKNNSTVGKPTDKADRIIRLNATGNMMRYVWTFNNKTLKEADKLLIKKGEHVRVIFTNNTMMEHPLHLHGHFFRLLNGSSLDDAPLKHTFSLMPMATDTIDFVADEEKDWFFHCHTLYHMMTGMARIFHYDNTLPDVQKNDPRLFRMFLRHHGGRTFFWGNADVQSQGTFGNLVLSGTRWEADNEFKVNYKGYYENETRVKRFIDKRQYITAFIGMDNRKEKHTTAEGQSINEERHVATAGVSWLLPMFITAEGRIDHKGNARLQIARNDLPLTRRTRLDISWNTDNEFTSTLKYIVGRNIAVSGSYDSDYGWGAGLSVIY